MFNRTLGRLAGSRSRWLILLGLILLVAITLHGIGGPGLGPNEFIARAQSLHLHNIWSQPLNAPHNLLAYGAHKIRPGSRGILRLSSYTFALIFSFCFYYIARGWFGKTVGAFSTLLFCLSPFYLTAARAASPVIMLFFPLALWTVYFWLVKTERKAFAWMILCLVAALAIYTPGMIWWVIGSVILCRRNLLAIWRQLPSAWSVAGPLLFLILLTPIFLAVARDPHYGRYFVGLPASFESPVKLLGNLAWMVSALFARAPYHSPLSLGRMPLLDLIQVALVVFGYYALWIAARGKTLALTLAILLGVVLAALNDSIYALYLGLPALGIIMAAGLRYLYIEWRSVFPRNPIPKSLALLLISVLVGINTVYGLTYSVVAWPHSSDTKAVYVLK